VAVIRPSWTHARPTQGPRKAETIRWQLYKAMADAEIKVLPAVVERQQR
jgi:hypothetical protein